MVSIMLYAAAVVLAAGISGQFAYSQQIRSPQVPCTTNDQCSPNLVPAGAKCASGFCVCSNDNGEYKPCVSHTQSRAASQNRSSTPVCKSDRDCGSIPHLVCNTTVNQCDCAHGYVLANSSLNCLPIKRVIAARCDANEDCTIANTTCRNNECVCGAGLYYSENSCWRMVEFEQPCETNQECSHVFGAICNPKKICSCTEDSVLNSDGKRCLLAAKEMMEPCDESVQCSKKFANAECIDKKCDCKPDSHFEKLVPGCVATKHPGDRCSMDFECYQDPEEGMPPVVLQSCVENVCTCNEHFVKEGDKCVSSGSALGSSIVTIILLFVILFFRS